MSSFRVLTKQRSRKSYKLGELNGDNKLSAYEITKKYSKAKLTSLWKIKIQN